MLTSNWTFNNWSNIYIYTHILNYDVLQGIDMQKFTVRAPSHCARLGLLGSSARVWAVCCATTPVVRCAAMASPPKRHGWRSRTSGWRGWQMGRRDLWWSRVEERLGMDDISWYLMIYIYYANGTTWVEKMWSMIDRINSRQHNTACWYQRI